MVMATDADINIEHRLTEVEARAQSNTKRLNEHDDILKSNTEMVSAIKELATTEVKYMRGDLNETIERLNKLESKDGDKWEKFKWLIVAGLVTLILGYLAVSVGLK
jgi:Flp pilus assembly protein TadB